MVPSDQTEPGEVGSRGPLVLQLVIDATDPVRGTVTSRDRAATIAFHGWIDLMSAISELGPCPAPDRAESA
ncbi:MAG TPA: hypothetical protein VGI58_05705 [Streptosporangiaceae bacterium]